VGTDSIWARMARVFLTFEAVPYSKREPLKFGPKTEILYNFPKRDEENLAFVHFQL
jgi:hypothetical protein